MFGRFEEAAEIHAQIAHICWKANMYDHVVASVTKASDCLMRANMPDDAFEGLRIVSTMMANYGQAEPALRLGAYASYLESRYPDKFKNSASTFQLYVYNMCKDKHLIQ